METTNKLETLTELNHKNIWIDTLIDTFVGISFGLFVGTGLEQLTTNMTLMNSLSARGGGILPNILISEYYKRYRNLVLKEFQIKEESSLRRKYLAETISFFSFQSPIYAILLSVLGNDPKNIFKGTLTMTLLSPVLGFAYGKYLDFVRKKCGLKDYYQEQNPQKDL